MKLCAHCNHPNKEGTYICAQCGMPLDVADTASISTRHIAKPEFLAMSVENTVTSGWTQFSGVILFIEESKTQLRLDPKRLTYVLGRTAEAKLADQNSGLDLTPFGALANGVSRIHAVMHRKAEGLTIVDMKSTNGTFINSKRLFPDRAYTLQNGDQVMLGRLVMTVRLLDTTKPK